MSIAIGEKAPSFKMETVLDGEFREITLEDYKGKWLVMFFYPLDFTFVCPTEIRGFDEVLSDFKASNAEVLGISVDSVHCHKAWMEQGLGGLKYPLASDITKQVSADYGCLLREKGISTRGTFIIDDQQILRYALLHDLNVGRNTEETLRVLRALQTGELCQLNWKPGEKTLSAK